jgi:hypothetical protein
LKVLSNNELNYGNDILEALLKRNTEMAIAVKRKSTDQSVAIVDSIKEWIIEKLGNVRRKEEKEALHAIVKACTYSNEDKSKVCQEIGVSNCYQYNHVHNATAEQRFAILKRPLLLILIRVVLWMLPLMEPLRNMLVECGM